MGTLLTSALLTRAARVLQDTTSVRWPESELLGWLNDGQREIVLHRPDSNTKIITTRLASGSYQKLVDNTAVTTAGGVGVGFYAAKLLDVIRNVATSVPGDAVRLVQREVLDAQQADWHTIGSATTVKHFAFDPRDPRAFYVYPAITGSTSDIDILFSYYPATISSTATAIGLADIYGNALLDYVLYRAYSKDSEYAGSLQRAQFHYQSFATSMQIELQGTVTMGPTLSGSIWNPNTPRVGAIST